MKREELTIGRYYTVRFGLWHETCLLCSIDGDNARLAIPRDSWSRVKPLSDIIAECLSPEEHDAIAAKLGEEARLSIDAMLAENEAKSELAPSRGYPPQQERMITKQGSHIRLGDYGT